VTSREVAVWWVPGESPRQGTVVKRRGPRSAVIVKWENGREEPVPASDKSVKYAIDGTRRLEWLLKPGLLESEFRAEPAEVFAQIVRDEGKSIQTLQLKRRVIDLGLPAEEVNAAFIDAKPILAKNRHLVIQGAKHSWSDEPVDPYADLRSLAPHAALDQLLYTKRLKPEQREALADAIRAALPPR
jgi:hypothetical protein